MRAEELLERALIDGLTLSISDDEKIRIIGDQNIIDKWLPLIREHKSEIVILLKQELRRKQVLEMLASDPDKKYVLVVENATSDPVRAMVGIRGIAVFELHIPKSHYDGVALLQVVEQYSVEETAGGNTEASTDEEERSQAHSGESQRKAA